MVTAILLATSHVDENAPKRGEMQETMELLGETKTGQETPLETLLRLIGKVNDHSMVG